MRSGETLYSVAARDHCQKADKRLLRVPVKVPANVKAFVCIGYAA